MLYFLLDWIDRLYDLPGFGVFRYLSAQKKPPAQKPPAREIRYVKIQKVRNASVTTEVEITGRVAARQKTEIFAEVTGTVLPGD
ncbi:MAG: hypothetical protein NZ534_11820, partial [Bacteroidia bacterium]|nr:hypothetical protein [Bacteroidia bacterium]